MLQIKYFYMADWGDFRQPVQPLATPLSACCRYTPSMACVFITDTRNYV